MQFLYEYDSLFNSNFDIPDISNVHNASEKENSTTGVRCTKTILQYDGTIIPKKNPSAAGTVYE